MLRHHTDACLLSGIYSGHNYLYMDNSWRMRKGVLGLPRRSSTEQLSRHSFSAYSNAVDPDDDFSDVFGGPPQSLFSRKFSCESKSYNEEVFRFPEFVSPAKKSVRNSPVFRIPARDDSFYSDIFGSNSERQSGPSSKTKSKWNSNSSWFVSSEELSPLRPFIGEDAFSANLRRMDVPCKWNSSKLTPKMNQNRQGMPLFPCNCSSGRQYAENKSTGGFFLPLSSPETMSLEPDSFHSIKISIDDLELNSPSSSICPKPDIKEEEEEDGGSYYVIDEIAASCNTERTNEAVDMDEVIAWAKDKSQRRSVI